MTYRLRNTLVAVALALVAALLTSFYVTNYQRDVQRGEQDVTVYVAARDVPAGTTGDDLLARGFLEKRTVERRNVVPGALSAPDQVDGLVASERIYAGEQVTTRRFTTPQERGVRARLKGNQRAIELPGDRNQLLAGTLKQGDRVDVVASFAVPEGGQRHVSRVILRDIAVLRAPSTGGPSAKLSGPSQPYSALLALTDTQVQKLFWVMRNGEWSLQLRPVADASDSPERVENDQTLLRAGVRPNQLDQLGGNK